jgi:ATP-dependent RNA helicase DOB1
VHCITTNYRPTPLQHYVFSENGDGVFMVVDEAGNFKPQNLVAAQQMAPPRSRSQQPDLERMVRLLRKHNWLPVIVFSFSRKECEGRALQLVGNKLSFNDEEEAAAVQEVFENAIAGLGEEDQQLQQLHTLLPLLRRGIGVHPSGLLPLLTELVELLFADHLIKILFATETFAMGVNMPAKTVMFTSCQKFDGKSMRTLSSGEYIQMSGRAGRRNKDKTGKVILMLDQVGSITHVAPVNHYLPLLPSTHLLFIPSFIPLTYLARAPIWRSVTCVSC